MSLAPFIDHTLLKPESTREEIEKLCDEAKQWGFAAVCVPPYFVSIAQKMLVDSAVKTATVIGFPFGYSHYTAKVAEIKKAVADGADELDMVINITALMAGDWHSLKEEISAVTNELKGKAKVLKLILETGILSERQIVDCCALYKNYDVQFLKTSTGYASKGATTEAVELMRKYLPHSIAIKASGGIRDAAFAQRLIDAGATRLGCSAGVAIMQGQRSTGSY